MKAGNRLRKKKILDVVCLPNGWFLVKTENHKSTEDFMVRTVYKVRPRLRYYTPKHAHFAIDLYGKYCADRRKADKVFQAIIEVWHNNPINKVIEKYKMCTTGLPGYPIEYILYALRWILEQEDINYGGDRPEKLQRELDEILAKAGIKVPPGRHGSQLAISLFCNIKMGIHPVDAFIRANLDVQPRFRKR